MFLYLQAPQVLPSLLAVLVNPSGKQQKHPIVNLGPKNNNFFS